jgi:hypothetical protein
MKSLGESDIWNEDEGLRDAAVRGFLTGELHWTFNSRTDTHQNGADWLSTQHNYAATPEAAVRLSGSVVKCLHDSSKAVRAAAVEFFGCCSADDGGALVSAVLRHRSLYRRTPYPYLDEFDNAFAALICLVAAREDTYRNEEAVQVLRDEIDRDPKNYALVAAMAGPGLDREWMLDQAQRLLPERPRLVKWYLGSSTRRPDRLEFLELARKVLPPEVLRAEIRNAIPNKEHANFYLSELGL